jgi:endoribonuclease Dicer
MCQPLENTLCEEDHYCVESTGAIVTMNSSVPLIYFFCSKLPFDESVFLSITNRFLLLHIANNFQSQISCFSCTIFLSVRYYKPLPRFTIDKALCSCTLHLPKSSPVQTVYTEGEVSVLKKAVCLKACRELHTIGALTDSLLPELGVPWEEEPDIGMLIDDEFD